MYHKKGKITEDQMKTEFVSTNSSSPIKVNDHNDNIGGEDKPKGAYYLMR